MKTDREIQQLVINALTGQPYLNSSEIRVSVRNGVVKLSGIVESECARVAIQNIITNGVGVKCVFDKIHILQAP
jgi:osmotically-inducible protein OsmY